METTRISNFGAGGLNTDAIENGLSPGQWSRLEEIDIRSRFIAAGTGSLMLDPLDCPIDPVWMFIYERADTGYLLISDGVELRVWDGMTYHVLASGWGGGRISYTVFLGTLVINSASDGPFYWDGNTGQAALPLPNWPAGYLCVKMIAFKTHLIAVRQYRPTDTHEPYRVAWSDTAGTGDLPSEWVPTETNLAGSRVLSDTSGHLFNAALLRDDLILYKDDSAYRMSLRNDVLVMDIERVKARIGSDCYEGVAEYGGQHLVLTRGDLVWFDGQTVKSVAVEKVREALFDALSKSDWQESRLLSLFPRSEAWLMIQTEGSPNYDILLKYDFEYNAFSTNRIRDVAGWAVGAPDPEAYLLVWDRTSPPGEQPTDPNALPAECGGVEDDSWNCGPPVSWSLNQYNPARDEVVFGSRIWAPGATVADPDVIDHYELWRSADGVYVDRNGALLRALAEKRGMVLNNQIDSNIQVKRVYPEMSGNSTVLITVGVQDQAGDDVRWGRPKQFRAGKDRFVNVRAIGQPLAVRVESLESASDYDANAPLAARFWKLDALTFEWQRVGMGQR